VRKANISILELSALGPVLNFDSMIALVDSPSSFPCLRTGKTICSTIFRDPGLELDLFRNISKLT
jgi:hypothetical protein